MLMKPKLTVSPVILKGLNSKGETVYRIKVINKSSFQVSNIRAQLHTVIIKPRKVGNKVITKLVPLKQDQVFALSRPKKDAYNSDGLKTEYATFTFLTYDDLEKFLKPADDNNIEYLRFRVYGINDFSGVGAVFSKFYKYTDLHSGEYLEELTFKHAPYPNLSPEQPIATID